MDRRFSIYFRADLTRGKGYGNFTIQIQILIATASSLQSSEKHDPKFCKVRCDVLKIGKKKKKFVSESKNYYEQWGEMLKRMVGILKCEGSIDRSNAKRAEDSLSPPHPSFSWWKRGFSEDREKKGSQFAACLGRLVPSVYVPARLIN